MRLTDIMSNADLTTWAEMGLVIFLVVFGIVGLHTLLRRDRKNLEAAAAAPLDDGIVAGTEEPREHGVTR